MQNMKSLLLEQPINSESQSSNDTRQFAEKQADWFNDEAGTLNEADGIDCPLCKNKGKIAYAKKIYEDSDRKEMYISECSCANQRNCVRYAKASGMGELLKVTAKDFIATEDWQKDTVSRVANYVKADDGSWLALLGQSGAGKTLLCSTVANTFLKKGIKTRYVVWGIMMKELKQDMFSSTGLNKMLGELQRVPVLYIDDLFKGKVGEQDKSLMFDLLNYRYNNKLVTLITSELLISDLAEIDMAIAGRIKERCGANIIQLSGSNKNYRMK